MLSPPLCGAGNGGWGQYARPYPRELMNAFDESSYWAALRGARGVFVEALENHGAFRLAGPPGAEDFLHATAAGKAMTAWLLAERNDQLISAIPLAGPTSRTMTDPVRNDGELGARLALELADCRQRLASTLQAAGHVHQHAFPPDNGHAAAPRWRR